MAANGCLKGEHYMRDMIKRFFSQVPEKNTSGKRNVQDVRVATCALFLEMAHIDDTFTKEETEIILSILKEKYQCLTSMPTI